MLAAFALVALDVPDATRLAGPHLDEILSPYKAKRDSVLKHFGLLPEAKRRLVMEAYLFSGGRSPAPGGSE